MKLAPRLIASIAAGLATVVLGAGRLGAAPTSEPALPATVDLKAAIGYALANNFAIRAARERIRQQEGVEITVRARQIPNVS
ncbi:MAG TPA: TolC family protein, partial [Opitutaceae bacterium]|nr:TolC family protein [Opitutaceae bacterium]